MEDIKSKLKLILNKITNIKINNYCWVLISFFIFCITLVLLHPEIITTSYLYAEDGKYFINNYFNSGLRSFTFTYGGYFNTLSRMFAMISIYTGKFTGSALVIGHTINILSIAFSGFVCAYFTSDSFSGIINSRTKRFFISFLSIILISNFNEMLYNGVTIHWWCGLLIFIVSLNLLNKKAPSFWVLPIVLISIVSTASSLILAFALLYYLFKVINIKHPIKSLFENMSKSDILKYVLMGVFLLIQVYAILFKTDVENVMNPNLSLGHICSLVKYTYFLFSSSIIYILGTQNYLQISNLGINVLLGTFMWILLIVISIKTKTLKYIVLCIIDIYFLYFVILYKQEDLMQFSHDLMDYLYTAFYCALPAIISFFALSIIIFKLQNRFVILQIILIVFAYFTYIKNIDNVNLESNKLLENIDNYIDFNSHRFVNVDIVPYNGWTVSIPVNDKY